MNNNFSGATFAYQKVTPTDDSVIRKFAFADGILYGCGLSFSGNSVAMAPGQLMVCGRQIRHIKQTSWMVTGKESGFARIVLTIDLTAAATEDVFKQIETTVEYADYVSDFSALVKEDIYAGGNTYQIELCRVSLFAGAITDITPQLDYARSDSTVLVWDGEYTGEKILFDTARFRFFWVAVAHEVLGISRSPLQSRFIISNATLPQKIDASSAKERSERTVTVEPDGLLFGNGVGYMADGTTVNSGNYCVPVRVYGVQ